MYLTGSVPARFLILVSHFVLTIVTLLTRVSNFITNQHTGIPFNTVHILVSICIVHCMISLSASDDTWTFLKHVVCII